MDLSNNVVIHKKIGEFEVLQFRRLLEYGVDNAYTLKPLKFNSRPGVVSLERYVKSVENYKSLCKEMNLDYNKLVKGNQTHTNIVKCVSKLSGQICVEEDPYMNTDGLITNVSGAVLATSNADCILLLFYDPIKKVIANTHSGWRGTFGKIAVNTINTMVTEYGCNPADIIVCICPSIRACHFQVKSDVYKMCKDIFEYTGKLDEFIEYTGKNEFNEDTWKIDTVEITKILLQECGVISENIEDCGLCSVCNKNLIHSCRADGKNYRIGYCNNFN